MKRSAILLLLSLALFACSPKESVSGTGTDPGTATGKEVITGDYSYEGYETVIINGTCNVEPLLGVSVVYGIMFSDTDLTRDPATREANEKDANNRFKCEIRVEPGGGLYYYRAYASRGGETFFGEIKTFKTREIVPSSGDAIDMGLSVKWASCNLGSKKVEDMGDKYAWGETKTKSSFSLDNYKFYSSNTYSKYNSSDGKTVLDMADDAANAKLGGNWRIPTREEIDELLENSVDYSIEYHETPGTAFVSETTGNVLFFPDSSETPYWSSTLYSGSKAYYTYEHYSYKIVTGDRYIGRYIRPVQGGPVASEETISISVSSITSTSCTVTLSPNASGTYYWDIVSKEGLDKYGADTIFDVYVKELKDNGTFADYLDQGAVSYDFDNLDSKTEYAIFAAYCSADGKPTSKIFTKSFMTK